MKSNESPVTSIIKMQEEVENLEQHRLANPSYFPSYVHLSDNRVVPALFTQRELEVAIERAKRNPEDIGEQQEEENSWLDRIFG